MTPEQFREHGHQVVDWVADYLSRVGELPVQSRVAPGDVRAALPPHPPEHGEPFDGQFLLTPAQIVKPDEPVGQGPIDVRSFRRTDRCQPCRTS